MPQRRILCQGSESLAKPIRTILNHFKNNFNLYHINNLHKLTLFSPSDDHEYTLGISHSVIFCFQGAKVDIVFHTTKTFIQIFCNNAQTIFWFSWYRGSPRRKFFDPPAPLKGGSEIAGLLSELWFMWFFEDCDLWRSMLLLNCASHVETRRATSPRSKWLTLCIACRDARRCVSAYQMADFSIVLQFYTIVLIAPFAIKSLRPLRLNYTPQRTQSILITLTILTH